MNRSVIEYDDRRLFKRERKPLELLENKCRINVVGACLKDGAIVARQQSETIRAFAQTAWHRNLLVLELPRIRHIERERHRRLVGVKQINLGLFAQGFEFSQDSVFEPVNVWLFIALNAAS